MVLLLINIKVQFIGSVQKNNLTFNYNDKLLFDNDP